MVCRYESNNILIYVRKEALIPDLTKPLVIFVIKIIFFDGVLKKSGFLSS